jgi:hypothetical protein
MNCSDIFLLGYLHFKNVCKSLNQQKNSAAGGNQLWGYFAKKKSVGPI